MLRGLSLYRFVLYEDGTVIRHSTGHGTEDFFTVHLEPEEQEQLLREVDSSPFRALETKYDLWPETSDQPNFVISTWSRGSERSVSVRGPIEACWQGGAPSAFVRVAYNLCTFSHPRERPWSPKLFELYVESARDRASCKWPSDWDLGPNLAPPDPPGRPAVHLIPGERLLQTERFLRDCRRTTGASSVLLAGHSVTMLMTVAMPHETYDVEDAPEPKAR